MGIKSIVIILILIVALVLTWAVLLIPNSEPQVTGKVISEDLSGPVGSSFPVRAVVTKVIDGDTVIIEGESVRLLGIDTDERGYPCYKEAKERIEELIMGKEVRLETDIEDKDQYDRYLRYIFVGNRNINLQMVEEGMAVARFYGDQKYKKEILAAEKEAREKKRGCKWSVEVVKENIEGKVVEDEGVDDVSGLGIICERNAYNCGDFSSHTEAQGVYDFCFGDSGDIHRLDQDKDGIACETLS